MGTVSKQKKWTVMVYLAGDNNLDGAGLVDLKEMKSVGTSADVNIIAQFDREGSKGVTRRYCLKKGTTLDADAVADLGETNCGDPKVLEEFITWGITAYPAEHYLVVLWNHGAGWDDTNVYRMIRSDLNKSVSRKSGMVAVSDNSKGTVTARHVRKVTAGKLSRALFGSSVRMALNTRAIAFDDQARDFIDNQELKKVLTNLRKKLKRNIDILGMDACLMNMAEVAYQVRESVSFTAGSEETEPDNGWPYDRILAELVKNPAMAPADLAKVIVDKYLASYGASDGVTQSALDLSKVQALADACNALATALIDNLTDVNVASMLLKVRRQVQTYADPDYVDLADLAKLIGQQTQTPAIVSACAGVGSAVGGIVVKSGYKGGGMAHSGGVSIYFPEKALSPLYAKLDFAKKTTWDDFIKKYQKSLAR